MLAGTYCEVADKALEHNNVAMAALNYRRATIVAPSSEAGLAAARAIGVFQKHAQAELQEVDRLIGTREYDEVFQCLNRLRRDYSTLTIAPKIEQARRRALRLREASERVAEAEPRLGTDPAAEHPAASRVVESAQPEAAPAPVVTDRGTLASIRKLLKQAPDDSTGPRLRGSDPRR